MIESVRQLPLAGMVVVLISSNTADTSLVAIANDAVSTTTSTSTLMSGSETVASRTLVNEDALMSVDKSVLATDAIPSDSVANTCLFSPIMSVLSASHTSPSSSSGLSLPATSICPFSTSVLLTFR